MARKKKLRRNTKDKLIAGVIAGLADYWKMDATILRIAWLIFLAFTGFIPGIVIYIAAIFIIPNNK